MATTCHLFLLRPVVGTSLNEPTIFSLRQMDLPDPSATFVCMLQRVETNGIVFYRSPLLHRAGVLHAFSTRLGGVSQAPFDSMNLGNPSGCAQQDPEESIEQNYQLLQSAIGFTATNRKWVHQVHGADVQNVSADFINGQKSDAMVSCDASVVLSVRTADCVPILIATDNGAVAAVHAGWRGVIANILSATLTQLADLSHSTHFTAAIGPCIGPDAFEVGDEVAREFQSRFGSLAPIFRAENGKGHVNLAEACRLQLLEKGLPPDQIDVANICTANSPQEFFSHRRDFGISGRMASLIQPK